MTSPSSNQIGYKGYVFLCGTRDYHAMDWYRSARELKEQGRLGAPLSILTESRGGEGFPDLALDCDTVHELLVIDGYLHSRQTRWGSIWRNLLKFLMLPLQVVLLRHFARRNSGNLYFAHSMYYIWLAWGAGVHFVATPQGSDLLIKPYRSAIYRFLTIASLRAAKVATVDSQAMAAAARDLAGVEAKVVQNGVDVDAIRQLPAEAIGLRDRVVSPRAITSLYQIDAIVEAVRNSALAPRMVEFIYPFVDEAYRRDCFANARFKYHDNGRVSRERMYELYRSARLVISIPLSDSSPRSVYEAIFCGAPVAIRKNDYYDALPSSMQSRIILVDLGDPDWFDKALRRADALVNRELVIDSADWDAFDQRKSLEALINIANIA